MSREEDEQIAIELFGFRWSKFGGMPAWLRDPYLDPDPRIEEVERPQVLDQHALGDVPAYTTDAAADYQVLAKVRGLWGLRPTDNSWDFHAKLCEAWEERRDSMTHSPLALNLLYEPGDYSRAALAVIKSRQPAEGRA